MVDLIISNAKVWRGHDVAIDTIDLFISEGKFCKQDGHQQSINDISS